MKNIKIYKKLISMVTAGMLMVSPMLASAEGNSNENTNTGFTLVTQEMNVEGNDLNIDKYISGLENSYNYLKQFINNEDMQAKLQILYTIFNRSYMSTKTYNDLADKNVIYSDEYINENFNKAFDLVYSILAYNEKIIREDYKNGTMDINHLIDPSVFCFDVHDKKIVRSVFEHYFNAYKNGLFENEDYVEAFKEITTLNSQEKKYNALQAETGATWGLQIIIGRLAVEMLHDDMLADYSIDELSNYYVREKLEAEPREWVLRDDVQFDLECLSELEYEIFNCEQLINFCYKKVNNNVYHLFNITHNLETANPYESYEFEGTVVGNTETVPEVTDLSLEEEVDGIDFTRDYTYTECVEKALEHLTSKISYDHLLVHAECYTYLCNREYLTEEEENDLITNGIVFKTDFNDPEGTKNFMEAFEFINSVIEYNQSVIKDDYDNGTMDINHLIDPSVFCMNANDRKLVHELHVAYFKAYKNGRFKNNYFIYVVSKLAEEKGITPLSVGAMWNARKIVGSCLKQSIRDDNQADYPKEEIYKVYDNVELAGAQWVVKEGLEPSIYSDNELEAGAAYYKLLDEIINIYGNNDLFESFGIPCSNTK